MDICSYENIRPLRIRDERAAQNSGPPDARPRPIAQGTGGPKFYGRFFGHHFFGRALGGQKIFRTGIKRAYEIFRYQVDNASKKLLDNFVIFRIWKQKLKFPKVKLLSTNESNIKYMRREIFESGIERAENFLVGHWSGRHFIRRAWAGFKTFLGLRACRAFFIRKRWASGRAGTRIRYARSSVFRTLTSKMVGLLAETDAAVMKICSDNNV